MPNWKKPVGRVRVVGMLEGASFLLLTAVAMPLKYFAEISDGFDGVKSPFVLKGNHLAKIAADAKEALDFRIRAVSKALNICACDTLSFCGY